MSQTLWMNMIPCFSSEGDSCEFGSQKYLNLCGFGGILSCGTTHTAVVPLDLVKCRMQVCTHFPPFISVMR
uniref:Solute carrier family 25 member 3 n=1 Tax=Sinocyclocheilus rhinocerous TaxID=307959 RepID=A0A673I1F4_9TELE